MAATKQVPFGMLFEESVEGPGSSLTPSYDERRDVSLVDNGMGELIPYVQFSREGTQTVTEVKREETDQDPSPRPPRPPRPPRGTETYTKIQAESTQTDY